MKPPNIKGIILDIDGVIIGGKPGFNFPIPNQNVIDALQLINKNGIPISLCTAKPGFAIKNLVKLLNLNSTHISSGGSEAINHLQNKIIKTHLIKTNDAIRLLKRAEEKDLYIEAYTTEKYAIDKDAFCDLTAINTSILDSKPEMVVSLKDFIQKNEIVKIMIAAFTIHEKQIIEKILREFPDLQLQWGANPMYAPTLFSVITKKGVTKKMGAYDIYADTKVSFNNMLGVGDGLSDWEFVQLCKYVGTLENADEKVKHFVKNRGNKGFVGKSVDSNGILDVFKYFQLTKKPSSL